MSAKLNLAALNTALGAGRRLYLKEEIAWAMTGRGKIGLSSFASNPLAQLGQSEHTSWLLRKQVGGGGTSGVGNMFKTFLGLADAIPQRHVDWIKEEAKAGKKDMGARIILDTLFSRVFPSAIQSLSGYALVEATSKQDLTAICVERFGADVGKATAKLVAAMHNFVNVATEKGQDVVHTRASTAVSMQTINAAAKTRKKRKAKAKPAAQA